MIERSYIDLKHELFDIYYEKLNDMQRESVYSVNGPNLILAEACLPNPASPPTLLLPEPEAEKRRFS